MTNARERFGQAVAAYVGSHLARSTDRLESAELAWFRTGAPSEELNGVLRASTEASVIAASEALAGLPALWHVWPGITPPEIEGVMVSRGLQFVEHEPLMSMSLRPDATRVIESEIILEEVTDRQGISELVTVWTGHSDSATRGDIVTALTQFPYGPGESRHFLLHRVKQEPVACACVFVVDGVASVENVVTDTEHRRHGIGTAMTRGAVRIARESGAHTALLTASPAGESIYRSLGFETVGFVRRFA